MNVRTIVNVRFAGRHRAIHRRRLTDDVGRVRHVWDGRLFDHRGNPSGKTLFACGLHSRCLHN
jgi:hypothetical protein